MNYHCTGIFLNQNYLVDPRTSTSRFTRCNHNFHNHAIIYHYYYDKMCKINIAEAYVSRNIIIFFERLTVKYIRLMD
jgi:hypothetical protein